MFKKKKSPNNENVEVSKESDVHYISELATLPQENYRKAPIGIGLVLTGLIAGFLIGLVVWAIFNIATILTSLLWDSCSDALVTLGLSSWWLPLPLCAIGGLVIGLWTKHFGGAPEELEIVIAKVKKTGGYSLARPFASIIGFLLPLVFGGSVGPEAGLTGIIAAGCTAIGRALQKAGFHLAEVGASSAAAALSAVFVTPLFGLVALITPDDEPEESSSEATPKYTFRKSAKIVLYLSAAVGACIGVIVINNLLGAGSGLPHFDGITPDLVSFVWIIPCLIAGYIGAIIYHSGEIAFSKASNALGDRSVLKPVIVGIVIGAIAMAFPFVLFSGEEQSHELMNHWQELGVAVLLLTGLIKCAATPLCLKFGWKGGHFFPIIFAGISMGYGIALISGIDPMFCVAITTATLMAGVQRKALVALALLLLCFPASSLIWMALACLIGAALPYPSKKE